MSELKVEYIEVSKLVPYARNSRTHSSAQVSKIMGSIKEFGFTNPILIDEEDVIIAGHGRLVAAQNLNMESVPCIRLSGLSLAQRKAYVIADNRLALDAAWDLNLLQIEMKELDDLDFDLGLTGFDPKEIDSLLETKPDEDETDAVTEGKKEFLIVIECESEDQQRDIFEELQIRELKCKII